MARLRMSCEGGGRKISLPTNLHETTLEHQQKHRRQLLSQHHSLIDTSRRSLKHQYKKLIMKRDELQDQVTELANYNYAREPDFVKDRLDLKESIDEVAHLKKHVEKKINFILDKVLDKLSKEEERLVESAGQKFEESEEFARTYLQGDIKISHHEFVEKYTKRRKEAHKVSILADRLTKEKDNFGLDILHKVAITKSDPTDSNNKNRALDNSNDDARHSQNKNKKGANNNSEDLSPIPLPRTRKKVCFNK